MLNKVQKYIDPHNAFLCKVIKEKNGLKRNGEQKKISIKYICRRNYALFTFSTYINRVSYKKKKRVKIFIPNYSISLKKLNIVGPHC